MDEEYAVRFTSVSCGYIEGYETGGHHPLLVGDELNGRYKIVHALGVGGSATVWLARDTLEETYVAIKVLQALVSKYTQEIGIHRYLSKDPEYANAPFAKIRDRFIVKGVNGRHVCLVLDLHGPCLRDLSSVKFRPDHARSIAKQIAQGIKLLHRNDVAFGDLSLANILLDCVDFSSLSSDALYEVIGEPEPEKIYCYAKDQSLARHAPKWFYPSVDFGHLNLSLLKPQIILTDLGEAQHVTAPEAETDEGYAIDQDYASPEYIFQTSNRHTKASDIWALAYIFYAIRTDSSIVEYYGGEDGSAIQYLIGVPPTRIREVIENKADEIGDIRFITEDEFAKGKKTIRHRLQDVGVGNWKPWNRMTFDERRVHLQEFKAASGGGDFDIESKLDTGPPPPERLSDEELADMHDLLSKMLVWEPEKRLSIDQVLAHPWLHKKYTDLDEPSEHWIEKYNTGCTSYGVYRSVESAASTNADDEETALVTQDSVPSAGVIEKHEDTKDNEELFVAHQLAPASPIKEHIEDDKTIKPQEWGALSGVITQTDGGSDATETSTNQLQGLSIPQKEIVEPSGVSTKD